jgi:hypothetical protein
MTTRIEAGSGASTLHLGGPTCGALERLLRVGKRDAGERNPPAPRARHLA